MRSLTRQGGATGGADHQSSCRKLLLRGKKSPGRSPHTNQRDTSLPTFDQKKNDTFTLEQKTEQIVNLETLNASLMKELEQIKIENNDIIKEQ